MNKEAIDIVKHYMSKDNTKEYYHPNKTYWDVLCEKKLKDKNKQFQDLVEYLVNYYVNNGKKGFDSMVTVEHRKSILGKLL